MPFTFSHPALILPLNYLPRKWFSLTGLVIGSITPDFEYFMRMTIRSDYSHTIAGLFWFDLPLGILLAFLFHDFIKNALFNNLPALKSRLMVFTHFNWNKYFRAHWLVVVFSVLLGAASHILWDDFTHYNGYFVKIFSALKNSFVLNGNQIPVYTVLQHASTLTGGLVIVFALFKLPVDRAIDRKINPGYWVAVFVLSAVIIGIRILAGLKLAEYGNIMVSCISAGLIALLLSPLFVKEK